LNEVRLPIVKLPLAPIISCNSLPPSSHISLCHFYSSFPLSSLSGIQITAGTRFLLVGFLAHGKDDEKKNKKGGGKKGKGGDDDDADGESEDEMEGEEEGEDDGSLRAAIRNNLWGTFSRR
jgi:hypothetical protein